MTFPAGVPRADPRRSPDDELPTLPSPHLDPAAAVRSLLAPRGITMLTQPVVRTDDGTVVGYEALARSRWLTDTPPDEWLDLAGSLGLRGEVEMACLSAAGHLGVPPHGARLFLNVSPRVLLDPRLDAILAGLPAHVLELTEHEPVHDYAALSRRVAELVGRGSLIAVDDVGAGYASMSHVLRLSPHFIKIDRSMVCALHRDRDQRAMVRAIAAFARSTGAQCIAEGVETTEELEALRDIDIDLVQGYLLARPALGWSPVSWPAHLSPVDAVESTDLTVRLQDARDPAAAARAVTEELERNLLLPSVYLERGGVLRCIARHGQWLVLDGMSPGIGMTGSAFRDGIERWAPDVRADPAYRPAIPGVRSELAVPLTVRGTVVGVLNVESLTVPTAGQLQLARSAARQLEDRLEEFPTLGEDGEALHVLAGLVPGVTTAPNPEVMARRAVEAATRTSRMPTAALWWLRDGDWQVAASTGPAAHHLRELTSQQVAAVAELAADVTSCHTGGGRRDPGAGALSPLPGVVGALIVPLRQSGRTEPVGLVLTVSEEDATVASDAVLATELLGLYVGTLRR